jgi:hypothetical protein
MTRMHLLLFLAMGVLAMSAGTAGAATTYSGSLTTGGSGLFANDGWLTAGSSVSWDVTDLGGGWWWYEYTLTVGTTGQGISHAIVEVTDGAPLSDFIFYKWGASGPVLWTDADTAIGTWGPQGNSNYGIPASVYGIKINSTSLPGTATNWHWAIETRHMPTWGDFYARDGNNPDGSSERFVYLYNNDGWNDPNGTVYAPPATQPSWWADDPTAPASGGSIHNNILRPDGIGPDPGPYETTPELSSFALLLLGAVPVGYAWRRRKKA